MNQKSGIALALATHAFLFCSCGQVDDQTTENEQPEITESSPNDPLATFGGDAGFDPVSDISTKVETNAWTIEEGIITHLKLHLGEIESRAYQNIDTQFEISDLVTLAYQYLQTGSNAEAKREIERLLGIIDPNVEDLLEHAEPVDLSETTGLLQYLLENSLDLLVPVARAQSGGCEALWSGIGETSDLSVPICLGVEEWDHLGRTHRIFFPLPWAADGDDRIGWVIASKDAINRALTTYTRNLPVDIHSVNARILTADNPTDGGMLASAWPHREVFSSSADCTVKLFRSSYDPAADNSYMQSGSSVEENYKQVNAHEIFHCIQIWNLSPQMYGPHASDSDKFSDFMRLRKWWSEGSAEYFANTVYPCNQLEWERIADFGNKSSEFSIVDMQYNNTVVFQDLANKVGDVGVLDVLLAMPTSGGRAAQLMAIGETELGRRFHEFAKDYVEDNVPDTCTGTMLPLEPTLEEVLVKKGQEYYYSSDSYQLNRVKLAFDSTTLDIIYRSADREADDSYKEEMTEWVPPPTLVEGSCGSKEGKLVFTFANTADMSEYIIEELSAPDLSSTIDSCLIGNWRASPGSAREIAEWAAANPLTKNSAATTLEDVTGSLSGSLDRNGRASGHMKDLKQIYVTEMNFGDKTLTNRTSISISGLSTGKYSADGSTLRIWNICTESTVHAAVEMDGKTISDQKVDLQMIAAKGKTSGIGNDKTTGEVLGSPQAIPSAFEFEYRCAGGQLEVEPPSSTAPPKDSASQEDRPPWRFTKS